MIDVFVEMLRKNRFGFIVIISFLSTIFLLNTLLDFTEKLISNYTLALFALIVFYFFVWISIKKKIWRSAR